MLAVGTYEGVGVLTHKNAAYAPVRYRLNLELNLGAITGRCWVTLTPNSSATSFDQCVLMLESGQNVGLNLDSRKGDSAVFIAYAVD